MAIIQTGGLATSANPLLLLMHLPRLPGLDWILFDLYLVPRPLVEADDIARFGLSHFVGHLADLQTLNKIVQVH